MKFFLSSFILLFFTFPLAIVYADDFEPVDEDVNSSNAFILDADNTGGDVTLQFGAVLGEYLRWNDLQGYFELSNSLVINGDSYINGTALILDFDETGDPDQDVEIVAEQGSENNGVLRYDDQNNRWELSNDGGTFEPILSGVASSGTAQYFDAYGTGSDTISNSPTYTDIQLDIQRKITSDFSHTLGSAEVTINTDGTYVLTYSVTTSVSGTSRTESEAKLQLDTGSGFTDVPGSLARMYNRTATQGESTGTRSFAMDLSAGDILKVQATRISGGGTVSLVPNGSSLTIMRVEGIGPSGPPGVDGTNTISFQDEGVSIANTPHGTLNFLGSTVTVTDAGSGVASVSISDDAATLDTFDSSQFLRSDTSDIFSSGTFTLDNGTTLAAAGNVNIGDGGDDVFINSNDWTISSSGLVSGLTGITSTGSLNFSSASQFLMRQGAADPGTCVVGSEFYNTTSNQRKVCTATNTWSILRRDFFGTQYQYTDSDAVSTTTSTTFQQKLRLTTASIPAGTYRIGWSYQWNHDSTNNGYEGRVQIDDSTEIMFHQQEPQDSGGTFGTTGTDQQYQLSGFKHISLTAGVHTIDIDYRTNNGANASSIWNARIEIWRVE